MVIVGHRHNVSESACTPQAQAGPTQNPETIMPTLKLPIPENDDTAYTREKRSRAKTQRKTEDLSAATVPDRSCLTCQRWQQTEETWGECTETLVVKERIRAEVYPPRGIETGTIVARWPNPNGTPVECRDVQWDYARAYGKAQQLRTHRTFPACDRYQRQGQDVRQPRRGPSLKDRVRGKAA